MNSLHGVIKGGQVIFDQPPRLPDGTRVEVLPVAATGSSIGMQEKEWPTTREGIASLLARMDKLETGWLTEEEEAAWRANLHAQRQKEKAEFNSEAEKLRGAWE